MTLAPNKIGNSTVGVAPTIGWELFSHDADVGIRGFGSTVAEVSGARLVRPALAGLRFTGLHQRDNILDRALAIKVVASHAVRQPEDSTPPFEGLTAIEAL